MLANTKALHSLLISKTESLLVNGLSKGFAMTGWRLGYIAAPVEIAKACEKLQGQFTSATNSITQKAAVTALTTDLKPSYEMVEEFRRRREKTMELVSGKFRVLKLSNRKVHFIFFRYFFIISENRTVKIKIQ